MYYVNAYGNEFAVLNTNSDFHHAFPTQEQAERFAGYMNAGQYVEEAYCNMEGE